MVLLVGSQGELSGIYSEEIDLTSLGRISIRRASHVEPDAEGRWWADMAPVDGPKLGPFDYRTEALDAERHWLNAWLACSARSTTTRSLASG
jgi:hypothetical protein